WKNVEQNIPIGAYVMPIILYSDATLCNHLGKTSRHPVFMTLGNFSLNHCNKIDAKILLGYIPSLEYNSISQKQPFQFRLATRKLFHHTFAAMLQLLRSLSNTGIHLYVNESLKWFYPHLALIILNWPEACMICASCGSPNSLHPCHFCLVDRVINQNTPDWISINSRDRLSLGFGSSNGYTSETYELLYKFNVKQPYHMMNKQNVNSQIQAS
ncbi:24324_t:CDS:2, partial [Dentiscutata erythropus]